MLELRKRIEEPLRFAICQNGVRRFTSKQSLDETIGKFVPADAVENTDQFSTRQLLRGACEVGVVGVAGEDCQGATNRVDRVRDHKDSFGHEANSVSPLWWATKDGDRTCLELANRHYSASLQKAKRGRVRKLFVGPGSKMVYRTWEGDACFVWLDHIDDGGQEGIYCSLFRNESRHQASELVRQADAIADFIWPDRRHYTFVDAASVRRSRTPGRCFIKAGWRYAGRTKGGKLILERLASLSMGGAA